MIPLLWLAAGAGGFILLKKKGTTGSATNPAQQRSPTVSARGQTTKNPASAQVQGRQAAGNQANQPWYQGPAVAAGGLALAKLVPLAQNMFTSSNANGDNTDSGVDSQQVDAAMSQAGAAGGDDSELTGSYDVSTVDTDNIDVSGDTSDGGGFDLGAA